MKKYSKFASAALATAMSFSAMGMAVMAADGELKTEVFNKDEQKITLNKVLTLSDKLTPVSTEFKFTLEPGTPTVTEEGPLKEYIGILPTGSSDNKFELSASLNSTAQDNSSQTYKVDLNLSAITFPRPGVYVYKLNETPINGAGFSDGEAQNFILKLVVAYEGEGDARTLKVTNIVASTNDNTAGKVDDGDFGYEAVYDPYAVDFTKLLDGNQGYAGDYPDFKFDLTIPKTSLTGDFVINAGIKNDDAEAPSDVTISSVNQQGVTVQTTDTSYIFKDLYLNSPSTTHKISIKGLTSTDGVVLTETETKGYKPVDADGNELINKSLTTSFGNAASSTDVNNVNFINNKDGQIPTGILLTAAPYAAVIGLGGVFAGLFFRRKRED